MSGIQLGLTWPLQRLLRTSVPYGAPIPRLYCWDAHCITLLGRSSLLLVHCASRYICVRFDLSPQDWCDLSAMAMEEIRLGLLDAGIPGQQVKEYLSAACPVLTRTHGRREVAFLNRAWEAVLAADLLVDTSRQHQALLCCTVNDQPCRCAEFEGDGSAQAFLMRCFPL